MLVKPLKCCIMHSDKTYVEAKCGKSAWALFPNKAFKYFKSLGAYNTNEGSQKLLHLRALGGAVFIVY